jgi:DNA-binding CsgD family transcriptional regulator
MRHRVFAGRGPHAGQPLELISFLVPSGHPPGGGVVHFLQPLAERPLADACPAALLSGAAAGDALTARETEVLRLLAEGLSTRSVARVLGISPTTVRNHVGHILHKLGAHRRIEAVVAFERATRACPRPPQAVERIEGADDANASRDAGARTERRDGMMKTDHA